MSTRKRCHGCLHAVELHTMRDGCTFDSRRTGICLCWYTPAFAARWPDQARGGDGGGAGRVVQ